MAETVFVCSNCGNEFAKWAGQCNACGEWNSLKEIRNIKTLNSKMRNRAQASSAPTIKNLGKMEGQIQGSVHTISNVFTSEIGEFDRVLGKGIVLGSVVLFGGEPGIGKSTLLTQLMGKVGGLYVAGEESAEQIGMRVSRLKLSADKFDILETNSIEDIEEFLERTQNVYKIAVVDSIQTMVSYAEGSGALGSVNQIREATFRLVQLAKKKNIAIFIVGHVTKEGEIAGPKMLEHMVDTVLYFEGDRNSDLRILRVDKNRFGPTDEVGVFKMEEGGLREIKSEEINLVESNSMNKIGSALTVTMEGTRPMMVEIQALVTESFAPVPKRVFSGIDYNRGQLLVAVAQKVLGIPLYKDDVFVSVTGGIRLDDTGCDLAVVAAMWSSYKDKPLSSNPFPTFVGTPLDRGALKQNKGLVFVGEVSLLGEVKKVRGMEKREKEVKGMGREMIEMKSIRELK